ncbi:MAG TPA: DNA methyltransferase [Cyanobacteria bacterium UBA11149]|nr:DNA methyltransferase [Cyanobacteria bacterium UBA11367]HBE61082.1 DNA methyltransferase [Cyanobacteria bacterium UBA11366]HBK62254.1 DNA methyltransferase [Cyanobacteria bacterium UBA11166]HBR73721.1 DNA methyltransferase [Cyanobacteria bacterium UBA11159]HBS72689.1 DNA methyltransferase [Cyanobacteria bacterium UBA11153]HBW89172.1 DNA methyltransferase [Cyanobacteria bacterium UBA11149]HCA94150.1 DNA methyltransferase [Cyanobacteria bacterium UBA9226]
MERNKLVKPFLKWAGGKRQLASEIIANYLPAQYNTYYEPFLGGGAIFFELQPEKAVVNDRNSELINCYEVIRDSVNQLIEDLRKHQNTEDYYYKVRDWDRKKNYQSMSTIERASRIIFLNKTCYNGLFRVNSKGYFNVPFGRYKNPNILDDAVLKAVSCYLNNPDIKILNGDFETAVEEAQYGDFVYLDPPYHPISNTAYFTGYNMNGFNEDEQIRLKKTVDELNKRGCQVLLSNADADFIRDLYKDYEIKKVYATRAINSNPIKRGKIQEVLVMNSYKCKL